MLIALFFVILVFIIGGLCMYILAKFVESGREKKKEKEQVIKNEEDKKEQEFK